MSRSGPYQVLFLCTGNSARSILAEALDRMRLKQQLDEIGQASPRGPSQITNP